MRHHDHRLAGVDQARKKRHDLVRGPRVEIARRLIGNDERRIIGKRPRNGGTLLLASRERIRQLVGLLGDSHVGQQT